MKQNRKIDIRKLTIKNTITKTEEITLTKVNTRVNNKLISLAIKTTTIVRGRNKSLKAKRTDIIETVQN